MNQMTHEYLIPTDNIRMPLLHSKVYEKSSPNDGL